MSLLLPKAKTFIALNTNTGNVKRVGVKYS